MTEHLLRHARRFSAGYPCRLEVRYAGGDRKRMRDWLGPGLDSAPQGHGGLDQRMASALQDSFEAGAERSVIIGTDIPGITGEILRKAFRALASHDLVFGPAADGGYYLIGMRKNSAQRALPDIFTDISWGTEAVLRQTLGAIEKIGLSVTLLDALQDVDRPEDLSVWEDIAGATADASRTDRISVIIPTLNEAGAIAGAIASARQGRNVGVIVADGGSRDATADIAVSLDAEWIVSKPPRAVQMNYGAARADGGILLFLHADTRLPEGYDRAVRRLLKRPDTVAGAFALGIDSPRSSLRVMERIANLRSRFLQKPYGDQALFTTREMFHRIGGFPEMPIMEDFELVRRLGREGRIGILPLPVRTSPRRWIRVGVWRTWLINQLVVLGYFLNVAPERLARFYRRRAHRGL
jgi:rSAM/selenodomain-associated transferase 2/rSAM/selenodomain-associated transferase 1